MQVSSSAPKHGKVKPCERCEGIDKPLFHCVHCDSSYCDECWYKLGPHKPGKTGPDGLPHEQADFSIVKRYRDILTPSDDPKEQRLMHLDDEDTTWFGIDRDAQNRPIFQDYGRYATIIANSSTADNQIRYPQLVSFIGQTGAGKSTIVKMLIDQQERRSGVSWANTFSSPVVGSSQNDSVPTSGDVHLYPDPGTWSGRYPMLYADCEGFEGGENIPISAQFCKPPGTNTRKRAESYPDQKRRHRICKVARGSPRDITWANSPEKQKREYAVTELYPRLLYTFSDVIVFVLRNPKTFESSVLDKLLSWASASQEKSLNQPTLPHAIIALNATDMEVNAKEWEPEHATRTLMSLVAKVVGNPKYRDYTEYWINRGKRIRCMKDLLECYYSSITVVRIPIKGRYMWMDEQISKLHSRIIEANLDSYRAKRKARMLSNSEELNVYLQSAFDHFARDLDTPFNFIEIASQINPIPLDFGGNILKLAVAIRDVKPSHDARTIFTLLSNMVASCIMLDCTRHDLKGSTEKLLESVYLDYCDNALQDFCSLFWRCAFINNRGSCCNVQEGHKKGHQNERGSIIGSGPYQSEFTWDTFSDEWLQLLQTELSHLQASCEAKLLSNQYLSEKAIASKLHIQTMNRFYEQVGGATNFISHSACFCCLREMPEHPLPCGHVLCTPCVKEYAEEGPGYVALKYCPLHREDVFSTPWHVPFKPELAGVRILTLDGGGIRGIIQLEILRELERALGGRIPIQCFFDLIVGTSAGGIIAISLGIEKWPIEQCISRFLKLVDKAFTPRLAGVRLAHSKYRTRPLVETLKSQLRDEYMFGGPHETSESYAVKVAVTSATETGRKAVIFTNYNRPADSRATYVLKRPDKPEQELKLWEAARATSAAPTFFKPFINARTNEGFLDGALFHNNPVRIANYESKLLWPDIEKHPPDILLSLGTGHNGQDTEGYLESQLYDKRRLQMRADIAMPPQTQARRWNFANIIRPTVTQWLSILFNRVDNILDSEQIWRGFRSDVMGASGHAEVSRYERINPNIGFRPPKLDQKSQLEPIQRAVKGKLSGAPLQSKIARIANRLVASSFYLEKLSAPKEENMGYICPSQICCRFSKDSTHIRALGSFLRNHQVSSFQPYFKIYERGHGEAAIKLEISTLLIREMIEKGAFQLEPVNIPVSNQLGTTTVALYLLDKKTTPPRSSAYPISGFPRSLVRKEQPHRLASPTTPERDRPKPSVRRKSLRHKQSNLYSNPSSTNVQASSPEDIAHQYPDNPDEIGDWVSRWSAVGNPFQPRGKQRADFPSFTEAISDTIYELPGENNFERDGNEVGVEDEDEDDLALARAIEESLKMSQEDRQAWGSTIDEQEEEAVRTVIRQSEFEQ